MQNVIPGILLLDLVCLLPFSFLWILWILNHTFSLTCVCGYFYIIILDSNFLLRFLRFKKFHITLAQEALERYILLRQTFGVAFNCLDITIPMMEELTDLGYLFACPKRDSKGRRVIIARPGK